MRFHFIPVRMATIKKEKKKISLVANVGDDVKKIENLCTAGRNVNRFNHYENSMKVPQ